MDGGWDFRGSLGGGLRLFRALPGRRGGLDERRRRRWDGSRWAGALEGARRGGGPEGTTGSRRAEAGVGILSADAAGGVDASDAASRAEDGFGRRFGRGTV